MASLFKGGGSHDDPYAHYRKRLVKIVGKDCVEILQVLFDTIDNFADGIDAERFRIAFKDRRDKIHRLTGRFIDDDFTSHSVYRPKLLALPLIDSDRAGKLLGLMDRILRYLHDEYEKQPQRMITIEELREKLGHAEAEICDAAGILSNSDATGSHSSGLPAGPDWYFMASELSLDYPDLDSVLRQHTEWAECDAKAARKGVPAFYETQGALDTAKSWIGRHKTLSAIYVGAGLLLLVLGYLVDLAAVFLKAVDIFDRLK